MGAPNEENLNASNHEGGRGCFTKGASRQGVKTVYFIRHAESDENRRRASLTKCFEQISTGAMPSTEDLNASFELLNVPAQVNSDVSQIGARQIKHMGNLLQGNNFLEKAKIQLVVHSPLVRARQTCEGLLGCVAKPLQKPSCVKRVEELDFLVERQPQEVPQDVILKDVAPTSSSFTRRIKQFEQWLEKQPEDIVAVVGHSLHFKTMLGVPFKFKNCEVWVAQFDPKRRQVGEEQVAKTNINCSNRSANSLLPTMPQLPPMPQSMQQMQMNFVQSMKRQTVSPWSGLKRVHCCDIGREG
ncbi:Pfam:PGAM [Seminavis robusta]|uniref:Pfam:PGAM n=1 Tax=Seminavis robusta TaxID=568900 RepID=A0A9N8E0F5_9STRA|nr:Pfam:PGAM [Seminavis robusta]|eukprot:Sro411_g137750.1 Pfam:PGAM (300) ;mRNA; r:66671-67570